MNALEKYAAKKKLTEKLVEFIGKVGPKHKSDAAERLAKAQKAAKNRPKANKGTTSQKKRKKKIIAGQNERVESAKAGVSQAAKDSSRARKQVAGGFAGLAGLAGLGLGAKALGKRSAGKTAIKGTQSAAKRLGDMARKHKKPLAVGGGVTGGAVALNQILKDKKSKKAA